MYSVVRLRYRDIWQGRLGVHSMIQSVTGHTTDLSFKASIGFLVDTGVLPVFYQSNVPGERTSLDGTYEKRMVSVRNGRVLCNKFNLDVEGFAFAEHGTKVSDFYDETQLKSLYDSEVEELIRLRTGASKVTVFDHTRRSSCQQVRERHNSRDPASAAHTDYTDWSACQRIRDLLPEQAERRLAKRFSIVNIWRSMIGRVEEWPLALCDARTVNPKKLHTVERRAYDRVGQTRHASYDPRNVWYYFPQMTRDEVILIKNYDSSEDGRARFALHSAFEDPNSPENASPRESIETRAFVFFD